ncbi:MAG: NTP transferase domain-containing protein [Patescibacteria group bacterium]
MNDTKVVILAAGQGKRMGAVVPKPLVPIAGKAMISHLLERVRASGLDQKPVVIVSVDGRADFEAELGNSVEYAVQVKQNGTGDALKAAEDACQDAARIIVLYGDHPFISAPVIAKLGELSRLNPTALVMLTATVPSFEGDYSVFKSWSRVLRNTAGKIIGDRQVKDASAEELEIREVNPCIFVFPAPWVWEHLAQLKNNNAAGEYYLTDLVSMAMKEGKEIVSETVDALEVTGINTPEELQKVEAIVNKRL